MSKEDHIFFDDFMSAGNANCGEPYRPMPPSENPGEPPLDISYSDIDKDFESIGGMSLEFGKNEIKKMYGNSSAHVKNNRSHILGDGLLVPGLKPTNENGIERPGVRGTCAFCKIKAEAMLQEGTIDLEEAERKSLFSTESRSQCHGCGRRDVCTKHCNDTTGYLCPDCLERLEEGKWRAAAKGLLVTLFGEEQPRPRLLPPGQQEQNHEIR
jgi:hypothetical protein